MIEYRADFSQMQRLEKALAGAPDAVREELVAAMTEADMLYLRELQDEWPHASGISRGSMHAEETVNGLHVEGFVGSPEPYVEPVDLGTRPHFPPIEALTDWVKLRFQVSSEAQAEHIARAIAWKIFHRGTEGKHAFERVLDRITPALDEIFMRARTRISSQIGFD